MSILKKRTYRPFIVLLLSVSLLLLSAQNPPSREYQIKAVFLFNFSQFIEWPQYSFANSQSAFVIGILGEDPFGPYLEKTTENEKVNNHSITIQRYKSIDEIGSCHILFIHSNEADKMPQIISALKGRSVLLVGDTPTFIEQGGMVRFYTLNNKIHLQINPEASKAAGMSISSKLLRLAEIVVPKKNKN